MEVEVGTVYMDRVFFNTKVIWKMNEPKLKCVIAPKSNKKRKAIHENTWIKYGYASNVFESKFQGGGSTFNIVVIWTKKKVYLMFATTKEVDPIDAFIKQIPEEYRKRWNIETWYK